MSTQRIIFGNPGEWSSKDVAIVLTAADNGATGEEIDNLQGMLQDMSVGVPNHCPAGVDPEDWDMVLKAHFARCILVWRVLTGKICGGEYGIETLDIPAIYGD